MTELLSTTCRPSTALARGWGGSDIIGSILNSLWDLWGKKEDKPL